MLTTSPSFVQLVKPSQGEVTPGRPASSHVGPWTSIRRDVGLICANLTSLLGFLSPLLGEDCYSELYLWDWRNWFAAIEQAFLFFGVGFLLLFPPILYYYLCNGETILDPWKEPSKWKSEEEGDPDALQER